LEELANGIEEVVLDLVMGEKNMAATLLRRLVCKVGAVNPVVGKAKGLAVTPTVVIDEAVNIGEKPVSWVCFMGVRMGEMSRVISGGMFSWFSEENEVG